MVERYEPISIVPVPEKPGTWGAMGAALYNLSDKIRDGHHSPTGAGLSAATHLRWQSFHHEVPGDRCEQIGASAQRVGAGRIKD